MQKNSILKHIDFTLLDLVSLAISFFAAYLLKIEGAKEFAGLYLRMFFLMLAVNTIYTILFNPYKDILRRDIASEVSCTLLFVLVNGAASIAILYAFKVGANYSRMQLAYTFVFYALISTSLRLIWKKHLIDTKKENKISVFVLADSRNVDSVVYNIENSEFSEYLIKGIYLIDLEKPKNIKSYCTYGLNDLLYENIVSSKALEVFAYCSPDKIDKEVVKNVINDGIRFHLCIDKIFGFEPDNEEIGSLAMYRTLNLNVFSFSSAQVLYDPIKRILDVVLSLIACLFLLPIYLAIKLSYLADGDKESILYTHTRIGKNGKEFRLYKFRSMVPNADEVLKELLKDPDRKKEWDENHKFDDDPRITKIGNFIRKASIDEFPQFLNVLKGDMSIIGPRPLVPGELDSKNGLRLYERVKPGITGWWACNGRSSISYEERLELEYYYVKNYSLGLDIMCVLKTIYVVLFRKGAK